MDRPYVGFWWRVLATLIDGIVVGIFVTIVFAIFGVSFLTGGEIDTETKAGAAGLLYLVALVTPVVYYALMEGSMLQATLGKLAIGAIVTDLNGRRLSYGRAFLREVCKLPSSVILYIGFIMVAFTARKQGLHDIMASTLVLKKRLAAPADAAV